MQRKKKEGRGRYTKSQVCYISPICGADLFEPHSTKISVVVGRVAPNFGFGLAEIRPFFPNSAKFGFGQIFGQIWPNLADANATAVRSVSYLITGKN